MELPPPLYDDSPPLPPFPRVFDSTMRSSLVACPRQFYWQYLRHLRKPGVSIHLHFGGCFARGLETTRKAFYRDGLSDIDALCTGIAEIVNSWGDVEPPDTPRMYKTLPACIDALASYVEQWPLREDRLQPYRMPNGEPAIEMSFAVPVPGTAHPTTGDPLVYAGRFDMLGWWDDAQTIFVCDEKTSGQLGSSWRNNWRLRGQLTGYVWGCRSYGIRAAGAIVRGSGILAGDITHEEVIETRPDWQVEQWLSQLRYDLNRAATLWLDMRAMALARASPSRDAWPQALDAACSSYGGCPCLPLCDSQYPERWTSEY